MNHISKSLLALDDFIKNVPRTEKEQIWLEVKEMNIQGPTVEEYFNLIFDSRLVLNFKDDIEICGDLKPPADWLKINIETSKFSLESFFCKILLWNLKKMHHFS